MAFSKKFKVIKNPDYGIDAPLVVKSLFLIGFVLALISFFSFFISNPIWFWIVFIYIISTCCTLFIIGSWMLYGIKITKPQITLKMILSLKLKGDEKVLDLGCGRGILLCKIAQHLPQGTAYGIDVWSTKDQSKNSMKATLQNAEREGIKSRVSLHTGDVCALPFSSDSFDAVVSSLCLHNIKDKQGREKALTEMLRVLKPGGRFSIADIQYGKEYASFLSTLGISVKCSEPNYAYCPPIIIIEGNK